MVEMLMKMPDLVFLDRGVLVKAVFLEIEWCEGCKS